MLGDISNQHLLHEDTSANSIIDHCFSVQLLPLWVPGQKIEERRFLGEIHIRDAVLKTL